MVSIAAAGRARPAKTIARETLGRGAVVEAFEDAGSGAALRRKAAPADLDAAGGAGYGEFRRHRARAFRCRLGHREGGEAQCPTE